LTYKRLPVLPVLPVLITGQIPTVGCSSGSGGDQADVSAAAVDAIPETPSDAVSEAGKAAASTELATANSAGGSGMSRSQALLAALTVFVLAVFLGFELITKVPPTLHTPLMSGSNAISGITVVGAVLMAGCKEGGMAAFLGMIAVAMAMVNVVGGFMVTDRMLSMFKKK